MAEPTGRSAASLQSLSDELLQRVFSKLPIHDRAASLPLVCKRFSTVLQAPSVAFEAISIDRSLTDSDISDAWEASFVQWLVQRRSAVKHWKFVDDGGAYNNSLVGKVAAVLADTPLESFMYYNYMDGLKARCIEQICRIPTLRHFNINVDTSDLGKLQSALASLQLLTGLRKLVLEGDDMHTENVDVSLLPALPTLEDLTLSLDNKPRDYSQLEHMPVLQNLCLHFFEADSPFPPNLPMLSPLTGLTLEWEQYPPCAQLSIPVDLASTLPNLQCLRLEFPPSRVDIEGLQFLPQISSLWLQCARSPNLLALASLTSVQELLLPGCDMDIDASWLRHFPLLKRLAVPNNRLKRIPLEVGQSRPTLSIQGWAIAKDERFKALEVQGGSGICYQMRLLSSAAGVVLCVQQPVPAQCNGMDVHAHMEAVFHEPKEYGAALKFLLAQLPAAHANCTVPSE